MSSYQPPHYMNRNRIAEVEVIGIDGRHPQMILPGAPLEYFSPSLAHTISCNWRTFRELQEQAVPGSTESNKFYFWLTGMRDLLINLNGRFADDHWYEGAVSDLSDICCLLAPVIDPKTSSDYEHF